MHQLLAPIVAALVLLTASSALAQIRCSVETPNSDPSSVRFTIDGKAIKHFETQTVITSNDPDLRPGYAAWACHRELSDFDQTSDGRLLVLTHRELRAPKEESSGCKVVFRIADKTVRTFTRDCKASCLNFDFTFRKTGRLCRNE